MELKLIKTISFYDVKFMGCDYELEEHREGDVKMYKARRKDGTITNKQEVDTLIEQFKLEQ